MATCYITMICGEVWVDGGESAINESCYRPILVESSAQWCIASQPTLRQKLEHNQHSSYSWTLSPWLTMNNKVCWFVFSYFRREWHATSDIVLAWDIVTLTRTLSSWVSWPVPMCLSWYVTVLSFLSLSYHSGLFSPRAGCLLVTFWWSWSFLLCCCCSMFQKIRVFQFLCFSSAMIHLIKLASHHTHLCPSHIQSFT